MSIFCTLVAWLGALACIPYAALFVDCDTPQLLAADVALNFVLLHGVAKVLSVFLPSCLAAVLEAALMGAIYYHNSPSSGDPPTAGRTSGLYSAGTLESFEGIALLFVWPFFLFETWQVAKTVWNIPAALKRIYEYSSSEGKSSIGEHGSGYWCDQMVGMDGPSAWYSVFELLVLALCLCLCVLSTWLHFLVYGPSTSKITTLAGYAIVVADAATVVLSFKAGNGAFVGAICNVSFVSFNLYRGYLNYNATHKSWNALFADVLNELKPSAPAPDGGNAPSVAHPIALVSSIILVALVVFTFVAEFIVGEASAAEGEKALNEVEEEMARLEDAYAEYFVRVKMKELGIALVQYLIEGALMVSYAGAVLALSKSVGPGYYMRLLQSVVLLGVFTKRVCADLDASHDKMD